MQIAKVTVKVELDNGSHKTYQLNQTGQAVKNEKTGKTSLAHFQPAQGNKVLRDFGKLYIDTQELGKEKS